MECLLCLPGEGRDPFLLWAPAFAGVTAVHEPRAAGNARRRTLARFCRVGPDQCDETDGQMQTGTIAAQASLRRAADDSRLDRRLRATGQRAGTRQTQLGANDRWACLAARNGYSLHGASRRLSGELEEDICAGFAELFAELDVAIDAEDPVALMVFPEMDAAADVPEITEACWGILGRSLESLVCATSRMVVKREGAIVPAVIACT